MSVFAAVWLFPIPTLVIQFGRKKPAAQPLTQQRIVLETAFWNNTVPRMLSLMREFRISSVIAFSIQQPV
jgi:hypothetical protein